MNGRFSVGGKDQREVRDRVGRYVRFLRFAGQKQNDCLQPISAAICIIAISSFRLRRTKQGVSDHLGCIHPVCSWQTFGAKLPLFLRPLSGRWASTNYRPSQMNGR